MICDRFGCDLWPLESAKRDLTSKEHWMLYYKLHAGCLAVFLDGFQAPKRQQKALRYLKESRIKNNEWDRISFDNFYFVQTMVATQMFNEETHVYIYIYIVIIMYIYIHIIDMFFS